MIKEKLNASKDFLAAYVWKNKEFKMTKYTEMKKEEWLEYGRDHGYDKIKRKKLARIAPGYYYKGLKERWIDELIPPTRIQRGVWSRMTKEEWLDYGREHGYDKIWRGELEKTAPGYYYKGLKEGWIDELIPLTKKPTKRGFWSRMTKEEWLKYGREHGYKKTE